MACILFLKKLEPIERKQHPVLENKRARFFFYFYIHSLPAPLLYT